MNRIRKLAPALCHIPVGFCFPLAILLVCASFSRAAAPPPAQPVAFLSRHKAKKLLIHVEKPEYPVVAKLNYIQGIVRLQIMVDSAGRVIRVHVVKGEPILAAEAIRTIRKWRYKPYVSSNVPRPFRTSVQVKFTLQQLNLKQHLPIDPEGYLERQIHPPKVVTRPQADPSAADVRLRVLVGSKGNVLDVDSRKAKEAEVDRARKNLRRWKFRPAYWGTLAVPWYLTVSVPLGNTPAQ